MTAFEGPLHARVQEFRACLFSQCVRPLARLPAMPCQGFSSGGICSNEFAYVVISCLIPHIVGYIEFNLQQQDPEAKSWYKSLKVPWRPSGMIYRPVWTFLYTGTGYAAYLVLVSGGGFNQTTHIPLINWCTQLIVNLMWGYLMFKSRRLELALANRLVLVFLVFLCAWGFSCINPYASKIMYGYLIWCMLSMSHNYNVWKLNPEAR